MAVHKETSCKHLILSPFPVHLPVPTKKHHLQLLSPQDQQEICHVRWINLAVETILLQFSLTDHYHFSTFQQHHLNSAMT